nr:serine hydrolase [Thermoanaerobaculia bacterium]
ALERVSARPKHYRLQVVVGRVETGADGRPRLVQQGFRLGAEYFYPASAVKLFAAVAALEKLAELRRETGLPISVDTALTYHPLFADEVLEDADAENLEGGRITVRQEIRKLFLVSDNRAFNRLYELVGQDGLAASLARAGLGEARIVHRLSEPRTVEENRRSPAIDLLGEGVRTSLPERLAPEQPRLPPQAGLEVGEAYLADEGRVDRPLSFAAKNRVALADLQRGLCKVVRPEVDCGGPPFALSTEDRALLLEAMSQYPGDSPNPRYDRGEYPNAYVKYLLPGLVRVLPEARWRVYNKVGEAYGFLTENAYVVEQESGASFFLAATLYTNEDGVLNDDHYDYETVGLPFLADLGEAVARRVLAGVR